MADRIIIAAQREIPNPTMPQLAQRTVETAQSLYDAGIATTVRATFQARGILP